MKIIGIEIENDRALRTFKVDLNGDNMVVAGETGTGKSTSISGLWEMISQAADAVTHGEDKGFHRLTLSDGKTTITAKRTYQKGKPSKIVIMDDKANAISMAVFKTFLSELAINPHKIASMKPTEQVNTLLKGADMGDYDLARAEMEISSAEDDRLELHRAVELIAPGAEPEKVTRVDLGELLEQKAATDRHNTERGEKTYRLESMISQGKSNAEVIAETEREIAAKQTRLAEVIAENDELRDNATTLQKEVAAMPERSTVEFTESIANAEATNNAAARHERWAEDSERHEAKKVEHTEAVAKVKELREAKKAALANAKWPIKGLAIEDGNILFGGKLLSNLGNSEQTLVCAALSIADILKHKFHVARIDNLESMSKKDQTALVKLYNKHGIQVLMARVSRGEIEKGEIVITDGEYVEVSDD